MKLYGLSGFLFLLPFAFFATISSTNAQNVGIGNTSPQSMLSVGMGSPFQVNSSGDVVKLNDVIYSWPSSQGIANSFIINDGSGNLSWSNVGQIIFVKKSADQTVSGTTLTNDNDLKTALLANAVYTFQIFIGAKVTALLPGFQAAITVPAGSTLKFGATGSNTTMVNASGTATSTLSVAASGTETPEILTGIIIMGSTAGNVQLEWTGEGVTPSAVVTTNSYILLTRVQ
jgi:hypothetical protein